MRTAWGGSISPGSTPRIPQGLQATEILQVPSPPLCQSSLLPSCCSCRNGDVMEQRSCRISIQWTLPTPLAPGRQKPNQRCASPGFMEILQGKSPAVGWGRKAIGRVVSGVREDGNEASRPFWSFSSMHTHTAFLLTGTFLLLLAQLSSLLS